VVTKCRDGPETALSETVMTVSLTTVPGPSRPVLFAPPPLKLGTSSIALTVYTYAKGTEMMQVTPLRRTLASSP